MLFKRSEIPQEYPKLQRSPGGAGEQLLGLIEAGRYTATAVNTQSVSYVIVQEKLEEFKAYAWKGWLSYADTLPSEQADLKAAIYKFHEAYQRDPRQDRLFLMLRSFW